LQLAKGQNLTLKLGDDLLGKLQLLLHRMNDAARWVLPADGDAAAAAGPDAQTPKEGAQVPMASGSKVLH
jgi:hypothetical protein